MKNGKDAQYGRDHHSESEGTGSVKRPDDKTQEEQQPAGNRLQKYAAVLLLGLIVVAFVDGYFGHWGIVRTLISLNTLELRDRSDRAWQLVERRDFQLVKINDVRTIVNTDSLLVFDQPYREAGYYRLYFRSSDSSSARLQKMYQAVLSLDTTQTIQHAVEDARRAYQNLQRILHGSRSAANDSVTPGRPDSALKIARGDITLGSGDEASAVLRKLVSDPHVLAGVGIGIAASVAVDLFQGNAYLALSKEDVFRLDSIKVGSRVGVWEGTPIDIVWAFGKDEGKRGR